MSESLLDGFKSLMSSSKVSQYQRLLCHQDVEIEKGRKRAMRQDFAKSKSGLHVWGPTHSQDSEDKDDTSSVGPQTPVSSDPPENVKSGDAPKAGNIFRGIWNNASETVNDFLENKDVRELVCSPCNQCQDDLKLDEKIKDYKASISKTIPRQEGNPLIQEISPVRVRSNVSTASSGIVKSKSEQNQYRRFNQVHKDCDDDDARAAAQAIAHDKEDLWKPPPPPTTPSPSMKNMSKVTLNSEKRDRKRHPPPFKAITFKANSNFVRSISELTMRSSLGESSEKISESRRMAYYAVGNHGKRKDGTSAGGNRRCYFTGDLIRGGQPFYAGSVQQGLRTLVVFCLPSALGLPKRKDIDKAVAMEFVKTRSTKSTISQKSRQSGISRYSSVWSDGAAVESQHTDWEEDENGNVCETIDAEWLLQVLPEPDKTVMDEMEIRYPEHYATLPQQVRKHTCWRLYMKFCFFSGLPIADGEMYYKVCDKLSAKLRKQLHKAGIDEITLSHEVMEAAHGQSAEIVNLPTKKTFLYLQKHYPQQCTKLSDRVFKRTSWEKIMPEV